MRAFTVALLWVAVGGMAAYWAFFFTYLPGAVWDPGFISFERAFPPADAVLAASAALTAELLRRQRPTAVPMGLFAAGQFCFLGALGATYNLQHGGYTLTPAGVSELAVNVYCLALAGWLAVYLWGSRHRLDAGVYSGSITAG